MAAYLALRIEKGALDYLAVVTKYPQFKDEIDEVLISDGYEYLII
jgi:hypothetical protein